MKQPMFKFLGYVFFLTFLCACTSEQKAGATKSGVAKDTVIKRTSMAEYEEQYAAAVRYVDSLVLSLGIRRKEPRDSAIGFEFEEVIYLPDYIFKKLTPMQKIAYTLNHKEMFTQNCAMAFLAEDKRLKTRIYRYLSPDREEEGSISPERIGKLKLIKSDCIPILEYLMFEYQENPHRLIEISHVFMGIDENRARKILFKMCKETKNSFFYTLLFNEIKNEKVERYLGESFFEPWEQGSDVLEGESAPGTEANKAKAIDLFLQVFPGIGEK